MSLNQIDFFVLPKDCLDKIKKEKIKLDDDGYFDDELIWNKYKIHHSMFNLINEIIKEIY